MNISPRQRDRHLQRVSRITRWMVVAAAGASGLFAFVLARPQSTGAKATTATSSAAGSSAATTTSTKPSSKSSSTSKSSKSLKPAPSTPSRSSGAAVASSGGS